jgi:hypothetical protein
MNASVAKTKLLILENEASEIDWIDAVVVFTNKNIPPEITMRLKDLLETTTTIGKHVYYIGKIIVFKIIEFIKENPNLAIGMAIGIAVGSLINIIPWIGSMLSSLSMAIGAAYGVIKGHALDKIAQGNFSAEVDSDMFKDLITLAKKFWKLVGEIFHTLQEYIVQASSR